MTNVRTCVKMKLLQLIFILFLFSQKPFVCIYGKNTLSLFYTKSTVHERKSNCLCTFIIIQMRIQFIHSVKLIMNVSNSTTVPFRTRLASDAEGSGDLVKR